jgi:hypothetical protein
MTKNTTTLLEGTLLCILGLFFAMFAGKPTASLSIPTPSVEHVAVAQPQSTNSALTLREMPTMLATVAILGGDFSKEAFSNYAAPHYKSLPMPGNASDWDSHKLLIVTAAKYAGVDPTGMAVTAAIETQFKAGAANGYSNAQGLFQFIPSTWTAMVNRYGAKYGITRKTSRMDPRANALMYAEYLKENEAYLASKLGRDPEPTELYMAHLLGAGGAVSIIKARSTALAINVRPEAVKGNKSLFYAKVKGQYTKAYTVYEFRKQLRNKLKYQRELYGESAIAYSELLGGTDRNKPMALNYHVEGPDGYQA